jgi:hypothetical protein
MRRDRENAGDAGPFASRWMEASRQLLVNRMRGLVLIVLVAATLTGCAGATIGPVDHECHVNPQRSWGSGCEDYP